MRLGHDRLESLTASLMFPPKGRHWQASSIGERLRARAYAILVAIVDKLGWDAFLGLRGEVRVCRHSGFCIFHMMTCICNAFYFAGSLLQVFIMRSDLKCDKRDNCSTMEQALNTTDDVHVLRTHVETHKYVDSIVPENERHTSKNMKCNGEVKEGNTLDVRSEGVQHDQGGCSDGTVPISEKDKLPCDSSVNPLRRTSLDVSAWCYKLVARDEDAPITGKDVAAGWECAAESSHCELNIELEGVQKMNATASVLKGELPSAQQLCNVWLDEVIDALYEDLSEYVEWRLMVGINQIKRTAQSSQE